jgi:hypothetical protein
MMKKQDLVKLIREVISEVDYDDSVKTVYTVTAINPEGGKVETVKTSREGEDLGLAPEKIELIRKYPETRDWKGLERVLGDSARHLPFSSIDRYMYDFKIDDNKKNLTIIASKGGNMTMKELRESIRTEIRRQVGVRGGMSEVISGRGGKVIVFLTMEDEIDEKVKIPRSSDYKGTYDSIMNELRKVYMENFPHLTPNPEVGYGRYYPDLDIYEFESAYALGYGFETYALGIGSKSPFYQQAEEVEDWQIMSRMVYDAKTEAKKIDLTNV